MEAFESITGVAAPLFRANIDTDTLIPSPLITNASREGYGPKLLAGWRYGPDGNREVRDFVLNQPVWRSSCILIAGENFGCGSSREMAVWAVRQFGFRCIIAPSFAPIFRQNSLRNGLLPITLPIKLVEQLARRAVAAPRDWTVDLRDCSITDPSGNKHTFEIDAREREQLLQGIDPISVTMKRADEIRAFVDADRRRRPWIWAAPRPPRA
ncbi:3-isopropylmalate dehydratase small subunit [Variovorax sp. LjRoot178]|uniref:3-isopropylmalate dehydratase small subunit n=1 Tax=Variovorax sp. LjRoot178 TaxID=3342277 RepID=UPI003ECF96DA